MRRSPGRLWLHLLRAVLLLGAAWAGFTVWAWNARPDWVRGVGLWAVAAHVDPWESRLAAAQDAADRAVIADALVGFRVGDRLGEVRRRALDALVESLVRGGELAAAARRSGELVQLDPRDVAVRIRHGEILTGLPERSAEGLASLRGLHDLLPADPRVAVATARALFGQGRAGEAMAVLVQRETAVSPNEWLVDWGTDFLSRGFVMPLREDDRLEVRFELPPGVSDVRLSPPPYCSLRLHEPVLSVSAGHTHVEVPFGELAPRLAGGSMRGTTVVLHGEVAGAIRLQIPASLRATALRCAVLCRVSPGQPASVSNLLRDPTTREALAESGMTDGSPGDRLLQQARLLALAGGRMQVFWREGGAEFAVERSSRSVLDGRLEGDRLRFSVELPVEAAATHLRLDLPEGSGHVYHLDVLAYIDALGEHSLDAATLEPVAAHSIERQGGDFRVTGADPWFVFAVPEVESVARLRVVGEVR